MGKISRRDFLRGTAAGAAAVGLGLMGAGCSSGQPAAADENTTAGAPETTAASVPESTAAPAPAQTEAPAQPESKTADWLPAAWDYEADVVIAGYGMAGLGAAREAIAEGVSCIVLEKCDEEFCGGSACASGGGVFGNQAEVLYKDSRGYVTQETVDKIVEESARLGEWLTENNMDMTDKGVSIYRSIKAAVDGCGATVLYEMPAKRLVFDPKTHEVFGICAEDKDGKEVYVKANKGVLLATGGFLGNEELVHRFLIPKEVHMANVGPASCTGDGLLMGLSVNAALKNMTWQCLENYGQGSVALKMGSDEMGTGLLHLPAGEFRGARIYVNKSGRRFMDEDKWYCHTKGNNPAFEYGGMWMAYEGFTNLPMYLIFDSQLFDHGCIGPHDAGLGWAKAKGIYNWSADNKAEFEKGWIVKGDTIEELVANLAKQSGQEPIDAEQLKATLETYNGYCEAGDDPEFGRAREQAFLGPSTLEPVNKPPYYACELVPAYIYTIGGLHWGEGGETLDWDGNAIPGLYHAGDVGQFTEVTVMGVRDCMAAGSYACRTICGAPTRTIPGESAVVMEVSTPEQREAADITKYEL